MTHRGKPKGASVSGKVTPAAARMVPHPTGPRASLLPLPSRPSCHSGDTATLPPTQSSTSARPVTAPVPRLAVDSWGPGIPKWWPSAGSWSPQRALAGTDGSGGAGCRGSWGSPALLCLVFLPLRAPQKPPGLSAGPAGIGPTTTHSHKPAYQPSGSLGHRKSCMGGGGCRPHPAHPPPIPVLILPASSSPAAKGFGPEECPAARRAVSHPRKSQATRPTSSRTAGGPPRTQGCSCKASGMGPVVHSGRAAIGAHPAHYPC